MTEVKKAPVRVTTKNLIEKEETVERFSKMFAAIHQATLQKGKEMFEVEKFNFLSRTKDLQFTPVSGMSVFLEVVSNGLSFSQTNSHVYLMTRNHNAGTKASPKWEKRLVYEVSADGRIFQAVQAGAIQRVSKPIIIYDCDEISLEYRDGKEELVHKPSMDRTKDAKIKGGYCYVTHANGERELIRMDLNDIERLSKYSAKQNKGNANALYTSNGGQIDVGFFQTKLIKYALKNIRKKAVYGESEVTEEGFHPLAPISIEPEETVIDDNIQLEF